MKRSKYVYFAMALFFLVAVLDISGIIFDQKIMRLIFKPLISPALMGLYLISVPKINKLYLVALFFAAVADVLLLNSSNEFFMLALASFLLMHLIYIIIVTNSIFIYKTTKLLLVSIPFLLVLTFVIYFVYNNLREFLFPIIIYGIVVCSFCALAFYNYLEKKSETSLLLFLGSFFFVISNSMSAIEKFNLQNRELAIEIMLTYVIAQFLIYRYMIKKAQIT